MDRPWFRTSGNDGAFVGGGIDGCIAVAGVFGGGDGIGMGGDGICTGRNADDDPRV